MRINKRLFVDILRLVDDLERYNLDKTTLEILKAVDGQITAKLEAIEKRKLYTEYKTSKKNTQERETARKKYLEKIEMSKDYMTNKEMNYGDF